MHTMAPLSRRQPSNAPTYRCIVVTRQDALHHRLWIFSKKQGKKKHIASI